jgi:hypothetical protein
MKQSIKRKIAIWLHCLFRFHKRGVIHLSNESGSDKWTNWACATCADRQYAQMKREATPEDIMWARKLAREHPEWNRG